jgi:transcriptional regulator with XRE-family HTH domain
MYKSKQYFKQLFLRSLGKTLRNRRIELHLTQEDVGKAAALHRTYITDIEHGVRNLSLLTLVRVSNALTMPLSVTFGEQEKIITSTKK